MRKNKRRFDPRYFMDEKTDKKALEEALPRSTQLPDEPDLLQYGDEQRMDQISRELEKQFTNHTIVTVDVPDFDGSMVDLDTFLTKMGNYVVTGDVNLEQAKKIIDQIVDAMRVDPQDLTYWEEPDPYDDPDYALSEMKPGAASGGISDRRYQTSRADSGLNEKFDTVVGALGQIGKIADGAVRAVKTEND
jgi:hypothetical protein